MHQNGKARKEFAKTLGLIKKKQNLDKTSDEYQEMISNAIKAGKNIHKSFEEETYNSIRKQLAEKESQMINHLMEDVVDNKGKLIRKGLSLEAAKKLVADNRKTEELRQMKLAKRKEKQAQK